MTQKILEAAAKACGYEILDWYGERYTAHDGEKLIAFNPLTNSADCAAMCSKLDINTFFYLTIMRVECSAEDAGDEQTIRHTASHNGTDEGKEAAWRYAATMVAAKIGGME